MSITRGRVRKVQHRTVWGRAEEMRGESRRGQERRGGHQRGETLTSEMLSGLVADMTASVPTDGAISLPSPIACCSLAWHSAAPGLHCLSELCSE